MRRLAVAAACCAASLGAAPAASAGGTGGRGLPVTIEDFSQPLRGWQVGRGVELARGRVDGDSALALRRGGGTPGWSGPLARRLPGRGTVAVSADIGLSPGSES